MNWDVFLPSIIAVLVALVGWVIVHTLNGRRDRNNKRRELITQYLVEAYRRLERSTGHGKNNGVHDAVSFVVDVETSIADIQLFGTPKQVELVRNFAIEFNRSFRTPEGVSIQELLEDLRRELRRELNLEPVPDSLIHLRLTPRLPDDPKIMS